MDKPRLLIEALDLLRCLVHNHITTWDQVLPMAEFSYNNSVNRSTCISPFEAVTGVRPRLPIDLVPLPLEARPCAKADNFIKHMQQIHEVRRHIATSNDNYTAHADKRRRFLEFSKGDMVIFIQKGYHQAQTKSYIRETPVHSKC